MSKHRPECPAPASDFEEYCTCPRCELCHEPSQGKTDTDPYRWQRSPDGDGYIANGKHRSAQVYKRASSSRNQPPWLWSVFSAGLQIARGAEHSMAAAKKRAAAVVAQER